MDQGGQKAVDQETFVVVLHLSSGDNCRFYSRYILSQPATGWLAHLEVVGSHVLKRQ